MKQLITILLIALAGHLNAQTHRASAFDYEEKKDTTFGYIVMVVGESVKAHKGFCIETTLTSENLIILDPPKYEFWRWDETKGDKSLKALDDKWIIKFIPL